jgi:hypothetical protein
MDSSVKQRLKRILKHILPQPVVSLGKSLLKGSRRIQNVESGSQRISPFTTIIEVYQGSLWSESTARLCLFAGFQSDGSIPDETIHHIQELRSCGFEVIYTATSPFFKEESLRKAAQLCKAVIHRQNIGHDFASWKAGLDYARSKGIEFDRLILTNDSIFGPFFPLAPVVTRLEKLEADLCGLNDSTERAPHLQSFFLYFKQPALNSQAFNEFWNGVECLTDKDLIIDRYEIGLSTALSAKGLSLAALYPYDTVIAAARKMGDAFQYRELLGQQPLNTSLFCWDLLIKVFGYPYLKTELLRLNRLQSRTIQNWPELVGNAFPDLVLAVKERESKWKQQNL